MPTGADILKTLIELYEKQENIKISYTLAPIKEKEVKTDDKPVSSPA